MSQMKRRWGGANTIQKNALPLDFLSSLISSNNLTNFDIDFLIQWPQKTDMRVNFYVRPAVGIGQNFQINALRRQKSGVQCFVWTVGDLDKFLDQFYNTAPIKRTKCGVKSFVRPAVGCET